MSTTGDVQVRGCGFERDTPNDQFVEVRAEIENNASVPKTGVVVFEVGDDTFTRSVYLPEDSVTTVRLQIPYYRISVGENDIQVELIQVAYTEGKDLP